jgi:hypothetical protein
VIEDREDLPQRHAGRAAQDEEARRVPRQPPPCESHARGRCACEDDGTGAAELHPEDELR